ncbi:MAG: hypothetical protein K2Q20_05700 [Phycisphaerales bacterium]|nr:hypothetical protein [Phycisphaerales bacterium]
MAPVTAAQRVAGIVAGLGATESADEAAKRIRPAGLTAEELLLLRITHPYLVEAIHNLGEQERARAEGEKSPEPKTEGPCKCPGEEQPGTWHKKRCHNWRAA